VNDDVISMSDKLRERAKRFLDAPMCLWRDIPPGDGARTIPNMTMVVRIDPACELADRLRPEEAKYLGVVIKTDQLQDGIAPGALLYVAPDAEVEHIVWHGPRTPVQ
jgi:hypothetical protein